MLRRMMAVIIGLLVGGICIYLINSVSLMLHPFPQGLEPTDSEAMKEYIASLPVSAFLIVLASHIVGAFAGGFACASVTQCADYSPKIVGLIQLGGSIMNMIVIPHPLWFAIADVIVYIPMAIAGSIVALKVFKPSPQL